MKDSVPSKIVASGFSLIELMVVLVLIALVTSVVFPNFLTLYGNTNYKTEQQIILSQISDLGFSAYIKSQKLVLDSSAGDSDNLIINVPKDWLVQVAEPIVYRMTGVCLGGGITLQHGNRRESYELKPPYCQPKKLD